MMNRKTRILCITFAMVMMICSFSSNAFARGITEKHYQNQHFVNSRFNDRLNVMNSDDVTDIITPSGFGRVLSNDAKENIQIANVSGIGYSVKNEWVPTQSRGQAPNPIKRVTVSLSSNSSRTINISAIACANGIPDYIGIKTIKLERYCNGRWLTVYIATNEYCYNVSRYFFARQQCKLASGGVYRVEIQFRAQSITGTYTISRTTSSIRCR